MNKKRYLTTAVSFSGQEKLLEAAKAKALSQRRSLSNYICCLIEEDLRRSSSAPENICAGKKVVMPTDLETFVPLEPSPTVKSSARRRK